MSEYRDDLAAAHRRIALLEEMLGARPLTRVPSPRGPAGVPLAVWGIAMGGIFLYGSLAALTLGLFDSRPVVHTAPTQAMPASTEPPPPARIYASWYTQTNVLPTMVDVDNDGTKDVVGLFWRAGQDERALYAAAIDGKTFTLKWSAGPFPSQWSSSRTHLVVAGQKVLVTDTQQTLHVLDLATGAGSATETFAGGVVETCALGDGTSRAIVRSSAVPAANADRLFDLEHMTFEPLPHGAACPVRYDSCYAAKDGRPCFTWGAVPTAPKQATTSNKFYVSRTLEDGALAVALGSDRAAPATGEEVPYGIGFAKAGGAPLWKTSLLADGDEVHFGGAQSELRDGRLVTFYPTVTGPFRVVARDAHTGIVQWSATVPDSHVGSYAAAFAVQGDRVVIVMNQTVHLFDVATGKHLAGLDASTI